MTTRRGFLGFTTGMAVVLSITQAGVTVAGQTGPGGWGVPAPAGSGSGGGSGGNIQIHVDRTALKCAPDSVRMWVDLSAADFDTPAPADAASYDPRYHELHVLWDFGDSGSFSAPVNLPAAWKSRNFARGLWTTHCYPAPGTYTVGVTVIEPASGKIASTSTTVTVGSAEAAYPTVQTICVNPVGDSDFAGAPVDSVRLNLDAIRNDTPEWTSRCGGTRKRWLFKRGGTFTLGVTLGALTTDDVMFGAYGSGARPVILPVTDGSVQGANRVFYVFQNGAQLSDIRISGLDFHGNFDPRNGDPSKAPAGRSDSVLVTNASRDILVSDCRISGFGASTFYIGHEAPANRGNFHLDDTRITDFGGQYPTFYVQSTHPLSSLAYTGLGIVQNPDSISADSGGNFRALLRLQHIANAHIRCCDFFTRDMWQPILKMMETPQADGPRAHIHSCAFEGGMEPITVNRNAPASPPARSVLNNIRIESNIIVGTNNTKFGIRVDGGGVSIEDNLVIQPACPLTDGNRMVNFVNYEVIGTPPATVTDAPQRLRNNTFVNLRSLTQNTGAATAEAGGAKIALYTNRQVANNIVHQPAMAGQTTFAPMTSRADLWEPRNKGKRDPETLTWQAGTASPAGSITTWLPAPGSSAIGAAVGPVAPFDLCGKPRQTPASAGAVEPGA